MQCQEMYTHDTIRNDEEEINKQSDSISFCKKRTGWVFFQIVSHLHSKDQSPLKISCLLDGIF